MRPTVLEKERQSACTADTLGDRRRSLPVSPIGHLYIFECRTGEHGSNENHIYLTNATKSIYLWYMKTQVNIKIDVEVKREAQKRAQKLGLSLSSVVNATLSQFARTGELTLSVAPRMTPQLEALVSEGRKEYAAGKYVDAFRSAGEMIESLDADI